MTTVIIPDFEKSIKYDRETGDFCVTVDGELLGYTASYNDGVRLADNYVHDQLTRVQFQAEAITYQQTASELAQAAHEAGDVRNERALNKAALALASGVQPREVLPGEYLIASHTRDGIIHRYHLRRGCSCEAGSKHLPCWHGAVVEVLLAARGMALAA